MFRYGFPVVPVIFWLSLALFFPLLSGNIDVGQAVMLVIFFLSAIAFGHLFLTPLRFLASIPRLIFTGFSFLAGSTLLFIAISVFKTAAVVYVLGGLGVVPFVLAGAPAVKLDKAGLAAVLPLLILLLNGEELFLALQPGFENIGGDYFYFEAIVVSLAETLSIFDSVYHKGVPLNYSSLPFFSPAALSYFTGISPHLSYSGIFVPLLKVVSFSVVSAFGVSLFHHISSRTWDINYKQYLFVSTGLILLAPVHFLYLAKLDIRNFILLGEGYLLPMGNMGFAFAIAVFAIGAFYVFDEAKKTWYESVFFVVIIAGLAAGKPALFLPAVAFYGFVALHQAISKKDYLLPVLVGIGFMSGMLVSGIFTGNDDGMVRMYLSLSDSYYLNYFKAGAHKFHLPASVIGAVAMFCIMLIMWLGLKSLVFALSFRHNMRARVVIICSLLTVLVSALPGWMLKIVYLDEHGRLLADGSFDTNQFLRAGLFISTVCALALMLMLWHQASGLMTALKLVTGAWFLIIASSLLLALMHPPVVLANEWEREIKEDFERMKPKLMGFLTAPGYSGQVLVAKGVSPWWICCERAEYWGTYLNTLRANYRNDLLAELLRNSTPLSRKLRIRELIKGEGVDVLVANPANVKQFDVLLSQGVLAKAIGARWLYSL